ncbi:MAG: nucleoside triphosphate pyrophosphohydrolase [Candidatus Dependentiae bacterium]|nr:nucleoside triphosphate pyrophosphohydrolase [Candidatus Dependentiae bacterium]
MAKFICNKLVRDKTVERMAHDGVASSYTILEGNAYSQALSKKLIEEALEVEAAESEHERIQEIADVMQVIVDLCKMHNITYDQIEAARKATYEKRGGFEKGVYVEVIEMDEDNKWAVYCRKYPHKYLEIK